MNDRPERPPEILVVGPAPVVLAVGRNETSVRQRLGRVALEPQEVGARRRLAAGRRVEHIVEVLPGFDRPMKNGVGLRGPLLRPAAESPLVGSVQQANMRGPGDEIPIVGQDVVLGRRARGSVLRVQKIEGDVAADDPLASEGLRCFH